MPKIYILHENDEWTKPLLAALKELNVPHEDWHLHEGTVPLDEKPPEGIFYNRMSASSHSRGHRYAPELTDAVINWLESYDRKVFNNLRALQLEVSKVAQYEALKQFDIPVPTTTAVVGENPLIQAAENFQTPFITKHNRAGKGLGVQRFDHADALKNTVFNEQLEPSVDGIMLLQQYISSPDNSITRCEFIGGKFLYAVRVDTSDGFELCPAEACEIGDQFCPTDRSSPVNNTRPKFEIIDDFSSPLIEKYEKFLAANGITFAGIEQITDSQGRTYTYDVNTNTNYNPQAEEKAGIHGMKEVAKFLKGQLETIQV
ncbi:alpha-L-glutamate ligase [Salipaludibacillus keqinensis]|uniref:Alpha-L-glutamate ligase n=1 Tax=Salipaludibacillus keqinensis TaxID=2045207 RepID=A0A323T598_9BACI|nr:alpha-L-glutamate ligase [Salipaludibacillus keqinensis]PYZ91621.1 alpha-L-glutamate ligase [Salipaludibacillus keqinensis]